MTAAEKAVYRTVMSLMCASGLPSDQCWDIVLAFNKTGKST